MSNDHNVSVITTNQNKINLIKMICTLSQKRPIKFNLIEYNEDSFNDTEIFIVDLVDEVVVQQLKERMMTRKKSSFNNKVVIFMIKDVSTINNLKKRLEEEQLDWLFQSSLCVDYQSNWASVIQIMEASLNAKLYFFTEGVSSTQKEISFLIVDDSDTAIKFVSEKLKESVPGVFNIDKAVTGAQAIEKCNSKKYDVIFLDVMLPDLDGYTICKNLKNTMNLDSLSVMLTSKNGVFDKFKGKMSGCDMYVVKPIDNDQIQTVVKKLNDRKQ